MHESGQLSNFLFSNAEPFQIEQFVNKQIDRVYLPMRSSENLCLQLATRTEAQPMVMVCTTVTADGHSQFVFIDREVKINAEYYRGNVLKTVLTFWANKHFGLRPWTFQWDLAPPQVARGNQEWLKQEIPRYNSTAQWPPKSHDLNPLDFCIWGIMESKVRIKKF